MTMASTATPAIGRTETSRWQIALLQLVFVYLIALKLWFDIVVTPMGDEAYYWMWGQHLSWSYFDHPPLNGWLQSVVAAVFGWSNFSARLLTWLTLGGTLWVLWLWSGRLAPDDRQGWFWRSAVIYQTIPVIFLMSSFAFHDHLLLCLSLAATYAFHCFTDDWENGIRRWGHLYLAAAFLGLAVLTKYNGAFLGLGFAAWVLLRPKLRALLLTPHLWLAALLAVAFQAPVFYWNVMEGMASFRFHLTGRASVDWSSPRPKQALDFLAVMALSMSPVLFLSLARIPFLRPKSPGETRAIGLSATIYLVSTIGWGIIALYIYVFFHWNIIAYAALAPIAARLLGARIGLWAHIGFGLLIITVAMLSYTVTPMKLLGIGDAGAAAAHGWPELASRVDAQHSAHPGSFLGATRYTYAAQLGFVLHDANVAAFNPLRSQNDYWWDASAHAGEDAIIVADAVFPIDAARGRFASVEQLETVPVIDRFGATIWTFEIWLGRGFVPAAP